MLQIPQATLFKLGAILVVLTGLTLLTIYVMNLREDSKQLDIVRREKAALIKTADDYNNRSNQLEVKLSKLKASNKEINNLLDKERENPVYTTCVVPDSGVQLLKRARDSRTR